MEATLKLFKGNCRVCFRGHSLIIPREFTAKSVSVGNRAGGFVRKPRKNNLSLISTY